MDAKQTGKAKQKDGRFCLIDAYRGITMISMVLYHACYDYFSAFGKNPQWIAGRGAFLWQQSICISFILVSGMVWSFGRRHALKRGIILLALGTAITLVTATFMPSQAIYYGVLTFMGAATLFMIPLDRLMNNQKSGKDNPVPTELIHILICFILFILTKHLASGYIGTRYHKLISLPDTLYRYRALAPLGLPDHGFSSGDYFPLIPWIFMYLIGYHLGKIILTDKNTLLKRSIPVLTKLGTKSLLVYIIHQPVCYALLWLMCR